MFENQKLSIDQFHYWFTYVGCHLKVIQTHVLSNLLINNTPFRFQPMNANDNNISKA